MTSPRKIANSLLWLAAIATAQPVGPVTVTRTTASAAPTQITAAAAAATSLPPTSSPTATTATTTTTATTIDLPQPTMYNLNSSDPTCGHPPVTYLEVNLQGDLSIEQAAVFQGIPPTAQRCMLKWRQADTSERGRFEVGPGHGRTQVRQLTGFPAPGEPITYDSLQAFDAGNGTGTAAFSPDFTYWPETVGPFVHIAGTIPCSPEIYLRIAVNKDAGDGFVHLDQDAKDGFYISYVL